MDTRSQWVAISNAASYCACSVMADKNKFEAVKMRMEERRAGIERKREARLQMGADQEAIRIFNENFDKGKEDIERLLRQSEELPRSEWSRHFDQLTLACQQLQKLISDSTFILPEFDLKRALGDMSLLLSAVNEQRSKQIPKKKFAFTSRRKKVARDSTDTPAATLEVEDKRQKVVPSSHPSSNCGFINRQNEQLELQRFTASDQDILVSDLKDCTVKIYGTPSTVHIDQLTNCRVFCGPVRTSVFIDRCRNCTLLLACQQLRVHQTHDCHLYIHVSSRAIIEDCIRIGVAQYNWDYDLVADDFMAAGFDVSHNNWSEINDFNWLNVTEQSPNWYTIAKEDVILKWDP